VQIDALALRLRPRTPYEAADLGTRLCQSAARDVYKCYLVVAIPLYILCLSTVEIAYWLPMLTVYWFKPWLDRTVLYVLSRAAFNQRTTLSDLWNAQRQVWWSQLFITLTWRLLSPWRSFTQPVYQLEGLRLGQFRKRILQIRRRHSAQAAFMTFVYKLCEISLTSAVASLIYWFAPRGQAPDLFEMLSSQGEPLHALIFAGATAIVVLFLEPFYVASGFAMYLTRRAELEAWDIEQEFRRAFGQ
jgi:hypothetical protein